MSETLEAPNAHKPEDGWAVDQSVWPQVRAFIQRGDYVAVYQNRDLSHPNCGHSTFVPLEPDEVPAFTEAIGDAQLPHRLGRQVGVVPWQYILQDVTNDPDDFDVQDLSE